MFSDHSGWIWQYDPDSPSQMSKVLLGTVNHQQKVDSRARKPISQTRPNHDFESKYRVRYTEVLRSWGYPL